MHKSNSPILVLHAKDDVAVARLPLRVGDLIHRDHETPIVVIESVPPGHKVALRQLDKGNFVRKYGQIIGVATGSIRVGSHVHTHNLAAEQFDRTFEYRPHNQSVLAGDTEELKFSGYLRPNGSVGTRNYLAVISNVNCSASVSKYIRDHFDSSQLRNDFPNVDGIIAFTHKSGCVIQKGKPTELLNRVLSGIARHPNIGGFLMVGLGCEGNQLQTLRQEQGFPESMTKGNLPHFLEIQSQGGTRKTVEAGIKSVLGLLPHANEHRRASASISRLILAENCGGSDANSGITANPALGWTSDELIRHGGSSVLAETPEIYGAEHLLAARAINREIADRLISLVRWWEKHTQSFHTTIDNNPSFGNKQGGLSTIYEKSLGAVAKGGQSPLVAVYEYAERVRAKGLCFMDTPGFDPVSMTGLMAGGCTIGVFTTGRGSVYGCKPMPCIKVATNTPLYQWMEDDMDINAGTILDGTESVESVGRRIFDKIIEVASGAKTKSEEAGIGDEEFAPWILGPTL